MNGCTTCGGFGDRHDPIAHGWELGAVDSDDLPAEHPNETARALERTREYIRARYGNGRGGTIPRFYSHGAVLFTEDDQ